MKIKTYIGWFLFLFAAMLVLPVLAQTNAPPATGGGLTVSVDIWDIGIGIVAPIVIWGLTKVAPNIPKPLLPTITPLIGVGLGFLVNWLAGQNLSWFESAKAGAMAVFFRELVNQWVTKQMATPDPAAPPPPPPTK